MPKIQHETLFQGSITVTIDDPSVLAFVERAERVCNDEATGPADLQALIYGPENPLLVERDGRAWVTPEAFEHPAFEILSDLIDRKRVRAGTLKPDRVADLYRLTVSEAAASLGVTPNAIRAAITAKRIAGVKVGGRWRVSEDGVEELRRNLRADAGDGTALRVRSGNANGATLRIKVNDAREIEHAKVGDGFAHLAEVDSFESAGVFSTIKGKRGKRAQFALLKPSTRTGEIRVGELYVRGRFEVLERITDPRAASERFKTFEPR